MILLLAGCALDREDAVREELRRWLLLAETRHFTSKPSCTAAVFALVSASVKMAGGPRRVRNFTEARLLIGQGRAVLFDMPGRSPSEISSGLMARDLAAGLGLLSSGVGPSLACMEQDAIRAGFHAVLTSPQAVTIYDPPNNALILVDPTRRLALFLRGNV
ncbi:hypothetical protein AVJ23_05510 [Pseudoponticoccus marisrubri]|uniref:Uncharacterized protein n=1 Tax=Pseudoponticoccus marisrubri TaxID=1685382 RepID=A0A0W7WN69_9RHOB|nr:hypothetical protein AVJ23_05510 [Pseudoponticoccus marisrubri]